MPGSVIEKTVELKKAHPEHGPRRISDVLKRFFLIKTSTSSVQKTLSDNGLTNKAKRKPLLAYETLLCKSIFLEAIPACCVILQESVPPLESVTYNVGPASG
jgi:hypothetical protein